MIRIVDHKKVDMTNDEYKMYEQICRAYDRPNFKGEELFKDLLETDSDGIILFVKPPTSQYSSLEVYCFCVSLMQNQHMRILYDQNKKLIEETRNEIGKIIKGAKEEIDNMKQELVEKPSKSTKKRVTSRHGRKTKAKKKTK